MNKVFAVLLILAILSVSLLSCGGEEQRDGEPISGETPSTQESSTTPSETGDTGASGTQGGTEATPPTGGESGSGNPTLPDRDDTVQDNFT